MLNDLSNFCKAATPEAFLNLILHWEMQWRIFQRSQTQFYLKLNLLLDLIYPLHLGKPQNFKTKFKSKFRPRTCVQPRLKFNGQNELLIDYLEQTVAPTLKSDQGPACTNTVEAVYLVSVIFSIVTGIGIVRKILSILILM